MIRRPGLIQTLFFVQVVVNIVIVISLAGSLVLLNRQISQEAVRQSERNADLIVRVHLVAACELSVLTDLAKQARLDTSHIPNIDGRSCTALQAERRGRNAEP